VSFGQPQWPRGPSASGLWRAAALTGAREPHPAGLRIAPSEDGTTYTLHPPTPRTQAEAGAQLAPVLEAMWVAVTDTVNALLAADAHAQADAAATATLADAAAAALRAALEPPPLNEAEAACVQTVRAHLQGFLEAAAVREAEEGQQVLQLAAMPRAIGLPIDLARGPVFSPRAGESEDVQLTLTTTVLGSLHNKPFTIATKDGLPEVRDGLLLSELIKRYVDQGLPESRNVTVTTTELCEAAGYATRGGRQFRLAVDALIRLRSATLENAVRMEDGSHANYVWGMVDAGWMRSGPQGSGQVRLSEELVGMVRRGLLVYYDRETLRGMVAADRYAARLWMFLEAEALGDTRRRYSIFSAPTGAPPAERDTPAIADVLDLREKRRPDDPTGWGRRRDIVRRIRKAAAVLSELDPRYTITVEQAKSHPSMKNLCVTRRRVPPVAPPVDNSGELCTTSRASCVLPVAPLCTTSRAQGDETPASHELGAEVPSVLPSVSTVSRSRTTGLHPGEEEPSRGDDPACTPAGIVAQAAFGTDTLDDFADLFGDRLDAVLEALGATVCRQFRNASGGACCREAAGHDDCEPAGWCPASDAFRGVVLKVTNYLSKRDQVKGSPEAYVLACIKRAEADPREMMGRTRAESVAAYDAMTALCRPDAADVAELIRRCTKPVDR
jgi:hypothetical protein